MRRALTLGRDNIDNTGYGVGAVERAFRSARYFDPLHSVGRQRGEIKGATKLIQFDAVKRRKKAA